MSALLGGEGFPGDGEYRVAPAAPAAPRPIRVMPVKIERVYLDGDYEGWWADLRVNAPFGMFLGMLDLLGGDLEGDQAAGIRIARALGELVVALAVVVKAWNFVDEAGQPLPCNLDGLKRLPKDLVLDLANRSQAGPTVPKG